MAPRLSIERHKPKKLKPPMTGTVSALLVGVKGSGSSPSNKPSLSLSLLNGSVPCVTALLMPSLSASAVADTLTLIWSQAVALA